MREKNIETVEKYLNALKSRDLSLVPFADEVEFDDPIAGKNVGAENFKAFLSGFLPAINDVKVFRHICEEDTVVTHFEVDAIFGIIPILELFRVKDGEIIEIHGFYDPRPVLGS
ncbi:hypothetical protein BH10ACI1_BH10ACI1_17070 [soil metagenome]